MNKMTKNQSIFIKLWTLGVFLLITLASSSIFTAAASITYERQLVEMRGVWVATVDNIDIPKQGGTSEAAILAYKNYYLSILNRMEINNLNTIFFQVRPMNDAFYPSAYNPWSAYLVGYGVDPGWDPLEWMIQVTHERGFDFHAWLNPYRTSTSTSLDLNSSQIDIDNYKISFANGRRQSLSKAYDNPLFETNQNALLHKVVLGAEKKLVLNPAHPDVIQHIQNTIDELITNYPIDGIHFDDYFYPANSSYGGVPIESSIDQADYEAYIANNPYLTIANWRRNNVDKMVKAVSDLVNDFNTTTSRSRKVAFGISPAAFWAPAKSSSCSAGVEGGVEYIGCWSYSTYNQLFADTKKWVEEEWLDYIAPQAYMKYDDFYPVVVNWWADVCAPTKVKLYIGSAIYRVSEWKNEKAIYDQVFRNGSDANLVGKVHGYILFSYRQTNTSGDTFANAMSYLRSLWKFKALTPVHFASSKEVTTSPEFNIYQVPNGLRITFNQVDNARGYALYRFNENEDIVFSNAKLVDNILQQEGTSTKTFDFSLDNNATKYVLRTIDANNNFIDHYTQLTIDKVGENTAPTITDVVFPSGTTLIGGEKITFSAKVTDLENNPLTVTLFVAKDGSTYSNSYVMKENDGIYSYTWEVFYLDLPNARFKIEASDGDKVSTIISNEVKIIGKIIDKVAPVISETDFALSDELTSGKTIKIKTKVTSADPVTVKLLFALDGENYNQPLVMKEENGYYVYSWKVPTTTSNNAKFKIVASNGLDSEVFSNEFVISAAPSKPGNNCKSGSITSFMSLLVLAFGLIIFRKRNK